jgi:hypothetical protein
MGMGECNWYSDWAMGWTKWISNPSRRKFSHLQIRPYSVAYSASTVMAAEVKWPVCAGDHSPPSTADVETEWSYTSTSLSPPRCRRGIYGTNLPLL